MNINTHVQNNNNHKISGRGVGVVVNTKITNVNRIKSEKKIVFVQQQMRH